MKLIVKLINNESFDVEVDANATVLATKQRIEEVKGAETSLQKLIHAGKVLKDDATLADSGVKEGSFVVLMISKPKAGVPAPAPPAAAPAPAPAAPAPVAAPPAASTSAATTPATTSAGGTAPAASAASPFAGPEFEAAVDAIKGMGYPEEQIRAALNAAFGNPDRAVEYLMSGVPLPAPRAAPRPAGAASTSAAGGGGGAPVAGEPLAQLRQHPQFQQLKQLCQSNPAMIPGILTSIGQSSPALLQSINDNKAAFLAMMQEPLEGAGGEGAEEGDYEEGEDEGEDDEGMEGMEEEGGGLPAGLAQMAQMLSTMTPAQRAQMAAQMGMPPDQMNQIAQLGAMMGGGGGAPPGATIVRLTAEENAAVERLCGMGFDRNRVLEAFLACDKNEEMAANYLLEHGFDDQ